MSHAISAIKKQPQWVVMVILIIAITLWFDWFYPLGVAAGIPYTLAIIACWRLKNIMIVVGAALICTSLIWAGYHFSAVGAADHIVLANRLLALSVIWITTGLAVFNIRIDQKAAERSKELLKARNLYQDLYHNSPDMYASIDAKDRTFVECNQTFLKKIGYQRDEIIGQELFIIYHPGCHNQIKSAFEKFRIDGFIQNEELLLKHKSGKTIDVLLNVTGIRDDEGRVVQSRSCWQDISEKKKIELKVHKLNAELNQRLENLNIVNNELESFSYSVSHDLRSPLRTIHGFCQALNEDHARDLSDQAKDYLNRITSASERMGQLIDDILNLSRISRKEFVMSKHIDVSALSKEVFNDLTQQSNKQSKLKVDNGIIMNGDLGLMRIVFENLIGNSIKYASPTRSLELEIGLHKSDGEEVVFVKDNGVGFDMRYADKLFGAFQRLHTDKEFEGTGIGLANVKRIISRHKGKIWAESKPGEGSTFFFTLNT